MSETLLSTNPVAFSVVVTLAYICFYTAYSKENKTLTTGNLLDFFLLRKGVVWTLVEANKAISLAGLTIMLSSFLPIFANMKTDLLWISMNLLWIHSVYSFYKFYEFSIFVVNKEKLPTKIISVYVGIAGQIALSLGYFNIINYSTLLLSATVLGIVHFWTMEVDYKYKLQVRPFAYLPFPLAVLVLVLWAIQSSK